MKITVFLRNGEVAEWTASSGQIERLAARFPDAEIMNCGTEQQFTKSLADADAALTWKFRQEWFDAAPKLKLLATPAAGHNYLPVTPPPSVTISFGTFHGRIIAETALACILGFSRGILQNSHAMRGGAQWPRDLFTGHARRLAGAQVVIAGFGHIALHLANMLKPFGVHITGIRRHPGTAFPDFFDECDRVCAVSDLDTAVETADYLVFITPDTPETTNLLDARRLKLMKKTAFVCNFGRGNCIDEDALAAALSEGRIAGAALDVFKTEPLPPDSPLREAPNCFLYPHSSAIAPDYLDFAIEEFAEKLGALSGTSAKC